jgi:hypothetical protein
MKDIHNVTTVHPAESRRVGQKLRLLFRRTRRREAALALEAVTEGISPTELKGLMIRQNG